MSTLDYYNQNAEGFIAGTFTADVSGLYARFERYLPANATILDLGCGSGRDSKHFIDAGFHVVPVDGSKELCRLAQDYTGLPVRQMLFSELDYEKEFDAVWACASLLHVPRNEIHSVLRLISKALKPGGWLYMSYKYGTGERKSDERFYSDYTEADIDWLCEATPELLVQEYWITGDVREGRGDERWLNIILRKACFASQ